MKSNSKRLNAEFEKYLYRLKYLVENAFAKRSIYGLHYLYVDLLQSQMRTYPSLIEMNHYVVDSEIAIKF